jgi:formiminotetrahydrofolate cyclodeaminase
MPSMTDGSMPFGAMTLEDFTADLASGRPVPGGGSAAAVAAALAASLTSMVVRLSVDRPAFEAHAALYGEALSASDAARVRFLALADEDASAYAAYRQARGLPRATAAEAASREAAISRAARRSADVPLAVADACARQVELVERLAGRSNPHASSDLDCAALLLEAAARAAVANVLVNLPSVADALYAEQARSLVDEHLARVATAATGTRDVVASGQSRGPEPA